MEHKTFFKTPAEAPAHAYYSLRSVAPETAYTLHTDRRARFRQAKNTLFALLDRLHLYAAPRIVKAECVNEHAATTGCRR